MKKKFIKKIFTFIMMIFIITSFSFAGANTSGGGDTVSMFSQIIDLLNIIWLPFAIIAGKLFTNDLVYGSLFGIDSMLWKVWQFSRTIANYIIGIIFIVSIFLYFIGRVKNIFNTMGKLIISSILVNMSWFLLAVIIDLSTILLVAVGSLPMHLIGTSTTGPIEKLKYCSVIEIDPTGVGSNIDNVRNITVCKEGSEKQIDADKFFSIMNNMTGPLVYIGSSILNIDKNWNIDSQQVDGNKSIKKSGGIRNMLHIIVILLFVVPIILLVIIGIIRVFWLWIYIGFSPFIILDYIFGGKYVSSKNKALKISNIIGLIFQPVLVVLAMGIAVIFLVTVQTAFIGGGNDNKAKKELGICGENQLCLGKKTVVTMEGSMMKNFMEDVGGAFGYIIITILTFVLMWGMIKLAFHSTEITSSIADAGFKFAEEGMKAVPILPTPSGGVGIGAMQKFISSRLIKRSFDEKAAEQSKGIISAIDNMFGTGKNSIGPILEKKYLDELTKNSKSYTELNRTYRDFLNKVKKEKPDVIPEYDMYFKNVTYHFMQLLSRKDTTLKSYFDKWGKNNKAPNSPEELFSNSDFRQILTGLIKDPNLLNGGNAGIWIHSARTSTNQLSSKIGDIH